MTRILLYLSSKSKLFIIMMAFLVVLMIGVPDYLMGHDISVSIFYLIPIILTTWFAGRWHGTLIAVASALTWLVADALMGATLSRTVIPYWNAAVRFGFFMIVLLLLDAFRREKKSARLDYLTELGNRRYFFEQAGMEINRLRRYGHSFTLAYIDVDDFKSVNDHYGHNAGDALLRAIAETIKLNIRATDLAARLGGDEFAVLLPESSAETAELFFNKLHQRLMATVDRGKWPVTFSVGVVTFIAPPGSIDEMIKIVDGLMYEAKSKGKNLIVRDVFMQREVR